MPLTMAKVGESMTIKKILGKDDTKKHLESLGFVLGENVTIVSDNGGNIIIVVKDTRVALDKKIANRILV
ncbi:ferrous iron transport protein A [Sedimentibacter acidaminivorans]|jgi:ferrous iron transport protein A|uniref:Ferrous iron transport protein A n=1 Tax=Sedimentibacter acidaminivorans TaxID=913099 RepID=A0ABS4GB77_9FIRM|nr:FeoA family protein [Sedimentibacter acidaminivorans]MBP1924932.1 ferrous iron transport protein A [Sedimentibacter acidaminivorans]